MATNPPENMPRVTPLLTYQDIPNALEFLDKAFGLKERMRLKGPDGGIVHAEVEIADGVIMLGIAGDRPDSKVPTTLGGVSHTTYVYVDDVDQHFEQARAAGATILTEPETMFWGDRTYLCDDPEGHRWMFVTHVQDMNPEDMTPA